MQETICGLPWFLSYQLWSRNYCFTTCGFTSIFRMPNIKDFCLKLLLFVKDYPTLHFLFSIFFIFFPSSIYLKSGEKIQNY